MQILRVDALPEGALAAAAEFYACHAAEATRLAAGGDLALVFAPADHTHRAWRLAAVQALARQAVPHRVNAIVCAAADAAQAGLAYLAGAPGVTGQILAMDGQGAGAVIG